MIVVRRVTEAHRLHALVLRELPFWPGRWCGWVQFQGLQIKDAGLR